MDLVPAAKAKAVSFDDDHLIVDLMDGRSIAVPLEWFPRLARATPEQRTDWQLAGGGYGIHWPEIDEDLSTDGLSRGAPAPATEQRSQEGRGLWARSHCRRIRR